MLFLKSFFDFKKIFYGIEVIVQEDGMYKLSICKLLKKKGEVEIIELSEAHTPIHKQVLSELKDYPVAISIDGKGVLHKIISNSEHMDGNVINYILPGANAGDFQIQEIKQTENTIISIIRNSVIDDILQGFLKEKINIVSISLGPFSSLSLQKVIDEKLLIANVRKVYFVEKNISRITENNGESQTYSIENFDVDSSHLISVANALNYLINFYDFNLRPELVKKGEAEVKFKFLFKLSLIIGFLFIGLVFGINYWLNNSYNKEYEILHENFVANQTQTETINKLEADIALKKELLAAVGSSTSRLLSFYADRLATTIPNTVELSNFKIFPLLKELKSDNEVEVKTHILEVNGNIYNEREFNIWLRELRNLDWVSELRVDEFRFDEKNSLSTFSIAMEVK